MFLIFSIFFGMFAANASASGFDIEYEKMSHHHFDILNGYIPSNEHGSCGYVAMSMVLSFYDCYWSDIFVAETYEGIKPSIDDYYPYPHTVATLKLENSVLTETEKENETAYRSFINNNKCNYLHPYLISLGIEKGYHPTDDEEVGFGITIIQMANVLDKYFDKIIGEADYYRSDGNYSESLPVSIHLIREQNLDENRERVIESIKTQVDSGNPVIYRADKIQNRQETRNSEISDDEEIGHFMVAYYSTDSEDILFHTGHTSNSYSTFDTTDYDLDIEALWIEINEDVLPHSCSDNYYWYPTHSNICSCNAYKELHPEHTHSNCGEYASNQTTHTYSCYCGQSITSSHNFTYTAINSLYHSVGCTTCGYTYTEMHPGVNAIKKPRLCSKCQYVFETFEPWEDEPSEELE